MQDDSYLEKTIDRIDEIWRKKMIKKQLFQVYWRHQRRGRESVTREGQVWENFGKNEEIAQQVVAGTTFLAIPGLPTGRT